MSLEDVVDGTQAAFTIKLPLEVDWPWRPIGAPYGFYIFSARRGRMVTLVLSRGLDLTSVGKRISEALCPFQCWRWELWGPRP